MAVISRSRLKPQNVQLNAEKYKMKQKKIKGKNKLRYCVGLAVGKSPEIMAHGGLGPNITAHGGLVLEKILIIQSISLGLTKAKRRKRTLKREDMKWVNLETKLELNVDNVFNRPS